MCMKIIKVCNQKDLNKLVGIMKDLFIEIKKPTYPIVYPYYFFLLTIIVDHRYAKPTAYYSEIELEGEIYSVEGWYNLLCIDN